MQAFKSAITEEFLEQTKVEAFKEFINLVPHKLFANHVLKPGELVIRVFFFEPKSDSRFNLEIDDAGTKPSSTKSFPIAKVLAAGPGTAYKAGDFVKLDDYQAATIENPAYKRYTRDLANRPMGAKAKDAQEPERYVSNIANFFGDKIFIVNPLKTHYDPEDYFTYKVHEGIISNTIVDPYAFLD